MDDSEKFAKLAEALTSASMESNGDIFVANTIASNGKAYVFKPSNTGLQGGFQATQAKFHQQSEAEGVGNDTEDLIEDEADIDDDNGGDDDDEVVVLDDNESKVDIDHKGSIKIGDIVSGAGASVESLSAGSKT